MSDYQKMSPDQKTAFLIKTARNAASRGQSKPAVLPPYALHQLLRLLNHHQELGRLPREAMVDLTDFSIDDIADGSGKEYFEADPPAPAKEQQICRICQKEYIWQAGLMPWLCSAPIDCPACDARCPSCRASDEPRTHCANSGAKVLRGQNVTCMCGAKFKDLVDKTIPVHPPQTSEPKRI